ncbi:HlyD family secretion protein [Olivibacter sp. LS-1]|uniref:HlyD family secretion protein n=1 Tax=Olivibacter sp. LS-1 TaxID=2592345 RepID=UPI0011EAFEF1|nr:HlyD family secretion protein [Olivibacter sp. LS-1]QEL03375.1 HlyD family secretion protein [Olivibacter sp. LS-1]
MKSKQNELIGLSNKITLGVSLLAMCVGVFYFLRYMAYINGYEDTNDAQVESYINPVSARVGGFIDRVLFEEHQQVKRGDTLLVLDNREYLQKVKEAEALLEDTEAQLGVLAASIHSAKTATLVNKDQISAAKAKLWQQEQEVGRFRNLLSAEAVTVSDFEVVQTKYDVLKSDYSAANNSLKTNNSKVLELEARYKSLIAAKKRAEATLDLARLNLSYTVITSPYTGFTGRKALLEGQQIQPGQPLVSVVNSKLKWVIANFKETQVAAMFVGQSVKIEADAFPEKRFHGRIEAIAASTGSKFSLLPTDNSTGNFVKIIQRIPVKIAFEEGEADVLKAGMNVKVIVKKRR